MADNLGMKASYKETRIKKPAVTGTFDRNAKAPVGLDYDSTPGNPGAVGVPLPVEKKIKLFDRDQSVASPVDPGHNFQPAD